MVKIAICDDEKIILECMYNKIKKIAHKLYEDIDIKKFINGNELLVEITNAEHFDILFLDIDMPEINGFEIANLVRKYNKEIIIIFLTSMDELVYESFKYNPFRFLRKQKVDEELVEVFTSAVNSIEKVKEKQYVFNTDFGKVKLYLNDIIYIECINRKVYLKTFNVKYKLLNTQFNSLINEFDGKSFILVHRSCMVNLKYVFSINKLDIMLDNKEKLPISRYRVNDIKRAFTLYAE
ncbi:LytTR family DNA-binding domain-containing protein [Clostridium sp. OS1-26]|uniref:LytR/AlgR family response regulator transcription factor n=1 Tax=Clostridium sp. OS1-26 TaxID=3070681 RepID=UPI0027E08452|nr:LytTR family DNA-binding domain-containing protein [Clostridium sp. OS1-26]WML33881.1 LytTR family DNA-binding domain-containing protein [Clostridium sp. OS1-26]